MPLKEIEEAWLMVQGKLMVQDSGFDSKAEKIIDFILKGGEWRKWKDTLAVGRIFPLNTLRFAPGILFGVTWLKVKERMLIVHG